MANVDIEIWANSIRNHLLQMKGQISDTGIIIPRVPERLRLGENDLYDPQIISFGPYHHGKPRLQDMEKYKWRYLEAILYRNTQNPLERYITVMKEHETKIRSCYPHYFDISSEKFVEMMLLDSCFVVEYLLRCHQDFPDELSTILCMHNLIRYDILLLENQIPFFILNKIFELLSVTKSPPMDAHSSPLTGLAISYLNHATEQKVKLPPPESVHHLLHLYHSFSLYTPVVEGESVTLEISAPVPYKGIPSATVLKEAGIKFMRKEVEGSSLDVTFSNGKMEIPLLPINAHTKSRLRNLVIFEQFYPNFRSDKSFSAYVEFINCLVTTPEDVALLYKEGIIHTGYGNKYAAGLLNQLNRGTASMESSRHSEWRHSPCIHPSPNHLLWLLCFLVSTFTFISLTTSVSRMKRRDDNGEACVLIPHPRISLISSGIVFSRQRSDYGCSKVLIKFGRPTAIKFQSWRLQCL